MKKLVALITALLMLLPAAALADALQADTAADCDPALVAAADTQVQRMLALARTDGYIEMNTGSESMADLAKAAISHDYSDPTRVAVITMRHDAFALLSSALYESNFAADDPVALDALCSKVFTALPTRINSMHGAEWLAASSILTTGDVLMLDGADECIAYVLAEYSADAPLTCVSFYVKDGGLASVSAQFVSMIDDMRGELFDPDALLAGLGELPEELLSAITEGASFNVYAAAACPVE